MRRVIALAAAACFLAAAIWAQRATRVAPFADRVIWEYKAILPQETSPAKYRQVEQYEVAAAAAQGWELVAVSPYVYQNEERGPEGRKQVVTQTYPAYYFKRVPPVH